MTQLIENKNPGLSLIAKKTVFQNRRREPVKTASSPSYIGKHPFRMKQGKGGRQMVEWRLRNTSDSCKGLQECACSLFHYGAPSVHGKWSLGDQTASKRRAGDRLKTSCHKAAQR
jgi:hypothetical protein